MIQGVDFIGTKLDGADLTNANLYGSKSGRIFFAKAKLDNTLMYDGKMSDEWQRNLDDFAAINRWGIR